VHAPPPLLPLVEADTTIARGRDREHIPSVIGTRGQAGGTGLHAELQQIVLLGTARAGREFAAVLVRSPSRVGVANDDERSP